MEKKTLILLYGGRSEERDISILSAESLIREIDYDKFFLKTYFITKEGYFIKTQEFQEWSANERLMTNGTVSWNKRIRADDIYEEGGVVFPMLHGPMGEDGAIQGFLETIKLAYVGTGVLASSLAMDKISTKRILDSVGIEQVPYVVIIEGEDLKEKIIQVEQKLAYPVFIKPSNMGSSLGISKARNRGELLVSMRLAFKYDSRILVEQAVSAREIEVGILGNFDVQTSVPGEIVKSNSFYDYSAKYGDNKISMDIPAKVSDEVANTMRQNSIRAFRAIGGLGLSRCDFFYTDTDRIFLNELNTMPGFTKWSMYPHLWKNMGLSYSELIDRLVLLAQEAFEKREAYFG